MKNPKINAEVYVAAFDNGFVLAKSKIVGCRPYETAFSNYIYLVETPFGRREFFARDLFESVEEFKASVDNYVVG